MINFFKNKYKLINSIYIFFLFFLIFFIKFSTINVLANSFKILDLEITNDFIYLVEFNHLKQGMTCTCLLDWDSINNYIFDKK